MRRSYGDVDAEELVLLPYRRLMQYPILLAMIESGAAAPPDGDGDEDDGDEGGGVPAGCARFLASECVGPVGEVVINGGRRRRRRRVASHVRVATIGRRPLG